MVFVMVPDFVSVFVIVIIPVKNGLNRIKIGDEIPRHNPPTEPIATLDTILYGSFFGSLSSSNAFFKPHPAPINPPPKMAP